MLLKLRLTKSVSSRRRSKRRDAKLKRPLLNSKKSRKKLKPLLPKN